MLTETQIRKLKPLTKHPKFGKLLQSAMIGWKRHSPVKGSFGIWQLNGYYRKDHHFEPGCCLIGAALVNKKVTVFGCETTECEKRFNLSEEECNDLIKGFDESKSKYSKESEGYIFAKKVNEIVKPK